jgi:predicted MPP superfamily phosphohydrolase
MIPAGLLFAWSSTQLEIAHHQIQLIGLRRKLRIVAFSDLHGQPYKLSMPDLVELVNRCRPDIFILAGDIIDRRKDLVSINQLSGVKAGLLKCAVLGNWEYQTGIDVGRFRANYESAGFHLLVNSMLRIEKLVLFGIDDIIEGQPDVSKLNAVVNQEWPLLVISHCPAVFDYINQHSRTPVVAISGHTHGGQIAPFGKALITPQGSGGYLHGWYWRGGAAMYVTRGIGTSLIPVRIGAPPEILVLDLETL